MNREEAEEYTQSLGQILGGGWQQTKLAVRLGVPQVLGLTVPEWQQRLGGYIDLSIPERREAVAELTEEGFSTREAAEILGVGKSTVADDLVQNRTDSAPNNEDPAVVVPHDDGATDDLVQNRTDSAPKHEPPAPAETPELPAGQYRCIVIDPPWPMQKIVREVRPNQKAHLDYPTLEIDEIDALVGGVVAAQDNCHVYLWVTQKHMPAGLRLFESWGVKYQCQMTWVKNVGPTPFSWMYDTEHVLFGQRGSVPLQEKGLRLSFTAKTEGHSVKPAVFYQRVLAASPSPRLAMFERGIRDGFEVWGNEIPNAA